VGGEQESPEAKVQLGNHSAGSFGSRFLRRPLACELDIARCSSVQHPSRVQVPPGLAETPRGPVGQVLVDRIAQNDLHVAEGRAQSSSQVAVPRVKSDRCGEIVVRSGQIRTKPFG
jgi:hypothetical protein